jgi:putative restriction endonuclease
LLAKRPQLAADQSLSPIRVTLQRASRISSLESGASAIVNIQPERTASNIPARRGQGLFKQRVMLIERRCRVTGVDNPIHLFASHCKPWRNSTNEERLNGENGLLLTPSIDHLFDRGFIGFEDSGRLIVSPVAHRPSLERMGIDTRGAVNVGEFTEGQRRYLEFHRNSVLLRAVR